MLSLLLTLTLTASPGIDDCGLEPPGAPIQKVGPKHGELPWNPNEPAIIRRELPESFAAGGLPQAHLVQTGALAGKTIYLSAGHGFTWSASLNRWATQRGNTQSIVEDLVSTESVHQYLVPMLLNAGARVITVRESDLNTRLVVVDDGTAGYVETGAGFTESSLAGWGAPPSPMATGVNPFALARNRLMDTAPTATANALFTANVPVDGFFNVYVSYSAFTARATDAHYVVKHAGGDTHFRVNQRRGGSTWQLLGKFYFNKGSRPVVQVFNDSKDTGTNVSLDAVRLGGGMGLIDRGNGVSARPRFEESARYHTQYAGAPTTVYDARDLDSDDDVVSRSRFAAWAHEPGEDAVYLAWHTNAFDGTAVGTDIYVYGPNGPDGTYNFTGVPGSDKLAQAVRAELINDIRASSGWNQAAWKDRGVHSAYFGELNPAHNDEMPSILMEIAFHDAAADAKHLKEPQFRYLATRAISQGIIKFFADKDGVAPKFPPEPPTHVSARTQAGGTAKISWRAPVVDAQGVGGAAPLKYRVFTSIDGLGWDDGVEVTGLEHTVNLPAGQTRFFRVAAINDGGFSFTSEVVGAKTPEPGSPLVLVVGGYDRLDSGLAKTENLATWSLGNVLRVIIPRLNDGLSNRRYGEALQFNGVGFDSASSLAVTSGDVPLTPYALVSWFAGRGHQNGAGLTAAEQGAIATYVASGKPLFFTGANAASALNAGSAADKLFLSDVLKASVATGAGTLSVDGSDFLAGLTAMKLDDGTSGSYDTGASDVIAPAAGANLIGKFGSTGAAIAANNKLVYFSFPYENLVDRPSRLDTMGRVLKYLNLIGTVPPIPDAGEEPDAGVDPIDAGTPADGGVKPDAGMVNPDGGAARVPHLSSDLAAPAGGCGCGAIPGFFPLLALALLSRRRRTVL